MHGDLGAEDLEQLPTVELFLRQVEFAYRRGIELADLAGGGVRREHGIAIGANTSYAYSLEELQKRIRLLHEHGQRAPTLVGYSWGALLAMLYTIEAADTASRQMLRVLLLAGAMHYPRSTPGMWPGLIREARRAVPGIAELDLAEIQRLLPQPSLTLFMDMTPEVSLTRKQADRDKFERDMPLLGRVRESYTRQSASPGWVRIDAEQDKDTVSAAVLSAVRSHLRLL